MSQHGIAGPPDTLSGRWWVFFNKRCLVGFPWFWPARPKGEEAMVRARRLIRRQFGRDHHPARRVLARAFTAMVWPVAALVHLWRIRRLCGSDEIPVRRAPGAIWAALRHNILPGEYYGYALWRPERRINIDNYLYTHEAARLFKLLNRPSQPDPIADKLAFHEMCRTHALPSPAVLAAFAPTGTLLEFHSGQPPHRDLFIKPRMGLAGHSAERLRWRGGAFESSRGGHVRPEDLIDYLARRACTERQALLVQPYLSNHPDLGLESHGALATARLITGHSRDGDVVAIFAFICFPRSGKITVQAGQVVLVDVASGRIAPLRGLSGRSADLQADGPAGDPHIEHDRALILPHWDAAVRHATAAHGVCPNIPFVGWDIGFTEDGPMLLEGNTNWSADEYQSLSGRPLGQTKFAAILATRLE
jgi:hypothetical protein